MACYIQSLPHWGRFNIGSLCSQCNVPLDCRTTFASNGTVAAFGGVPRGHLEADVDVTGLGIAVAITFPSVLGFIIGSFLIGSFVNVQSRKGKTAGLSERQYSILECILRSISDIQILIALALAMSLVFGMCKILQYHLDVGVNLLLLVCANYLLTLGLVRHHWRSWPAGLAALVRLLAVVGIYFFIGWILALQNAHAFLSENSLTAEHLPGKKNDSAILLQAACFLDPSFQSAFDQLDGNQRDLIGLTKNNGLAGEWVLGLLLATMTATILIFRLLHSFGHLFSRRYKSKPPLADLARKGGLRYAYWVIIWILSFSVLCYSLFTIINLRKWVSQSGWLRSQYLTNPENNIVGLGQILVLVLMATVLIAALDNLAMDGNNTKRKGSPKLNKTKKSPLLKNKKGGPKMKKTNGASKIKTRKLGKETV